MAPMDVKAKFAVRRTFLLAFVLTFPARVLININFPGDIHDVDMLILGAGL